MEREEKNNKVLFKYSSLIAGFTLTELIVVLAIIAMLLVLGVLAYKNQINKGRDAKRKSDIYQIKVALEEYEKDHECYPATLPFCRTTPHELDTYIPYIPCNPDGEDYTYHVPLDVPICAEWYWVFAKLENELDPIIEELGCTLGCGPSQETADYNYYDTSPNAPDMISGAVRWGCIGGVCQGIYWDEETGGECDPYYGSSNCNNVCGDLIDECIFK